MIQKTGSFVTDYVLRRVLEKINLSKLLLTTLMTRKKDLIDKDSAGKTNEPRGKLKNKKIFFLIMAAMSSFVLLLLFSGGFSFWLWLDLLLWIGYFVFVKKKYLEGTISFNKVLGLGIGLIFLSFIFVIFTLPEQSSPSSLNKSVLDDSSEDVQEIELQKEPSKTEVLLMELQKETGLPFSEIENSQQIWKGPNTNLILSEVVSFQLEDANQESVDQIKAFFDKRDWNHGSLSFTYTPLPGNDEIGYTPSSIESDYAKTMCVINLNNEDIVVVKCGLGP